MSVALKCYVIELADFDPEKGQIYQPRATPWAGIS